MARTPRQPRKWAPPQGTLAFFDFDVNTGLVKKPGAIPEGVKIGPPERMKAAFCKLLGLPHKQHKHITLKLEDKRWPAILDATERRRGSAFRFSALWFEEPEPDPVDSHNWFEPSSGAGDFLGPARAPEGRHYLWSDAHFASQKLVDCVKKNRLSGLEFLPLPEPFARSKPGPMAWYEVFATDPLGRGLDHPMLNVEKHEEELKRGREPLEPSRRWGQHVVEWALTRRDIEPDHPLIAEAVKLRPPHMRIVGHERFVREHLPKTDFAFTSWGWTDTGRLSFGGKFRQIACNNRARRALVDAGLFKPQWFKVLPTITAADAERQGVAILDRTVKHPLPAPLYTSEECRAQRARRGAIGAPGKPKRPPAPRYKTAAQVAAAIKKRIAAGDPPWPALPASKFKRVKASPLFKRTPKAWQTLLPRLPSELEVKVDGRPFEFTLVEPAWNEWLPGDDDDRPAPEKPSPKDLGLAGTPHGDWFSVRIKGGKPTAEARIVHWDHETLTIAEEWPTIAAFVSFMLAAVPPKR